MTLLRLPPAGIHNTYLFCRRGNATFRLLLKNVQDVNSLGKAHCINSAISRLVLLMHDFSNSGAGKSLQRLCARVLITCLREKKRVAEKVLHGVRQIAQVIKR